MCDCSQKGSIPPLQSWLGGFLKPMRTFKLDLNNGNAAAQARRVLCEIPPATFTKAGDLNQSLLFQMDRTIDDTP